MKEKGLQFIEFKRRSHGSRIGHNQGFQSFTHFLGTLAGQKIKIHKIHVTHPLGVLTYPS